MAFFHPPPFVFLLIVQTICVVAQNNSGYVSVGESLIATDDTTSWLSPSGDFAFGFSPLSQNDLFLLSIWFAKIPDKTIVWYANADNPALRGSKVELITDRGLVLTGPQGDELWATNTSGTLYGVMSNTGNFVLEDSNFSRFQLRFIDNLLLNTINLATDNPNDAYYAAGDSSASSPGKQLVFNESGYIYILKNNSQTFPLNQATVGSTADSNYRATLNFNGVFTQYSHPKTSNANVSWTVIWYLPDNICVSSNVRTGSGTCGYNSICTLKPDRRPMCTCPNGYSLLDPNDQYGSGIPDFIQGCEEDKLSPGKDLYSFEVLINTDWPNSDYEFLKPYIEDQCKTSCMEACMCAVAIFRLGDSCWKKLPLSNGKMDSNLNGGKAFIKIRNNNSITLPDGGLPNPEAKKNQDKLIFMWSMPLGGSVFFNIILIVAICIGAFFLNNKKLKRPRINFNVVEMNLQCFTYKELVEATDGFKEELGRGAFGVVYKGAMQMSSNVLVAVKKLNSLFQESEKEF
ncbi:G-type lectin S-receptor-like serine/threonine-protein kinase RLK1 [Quercus lobata]|uniref:G-type lectin S-receptor-like serine/threonine-protein kinase RLK1 n=1 Tax=Quercus lobata TaxID=97700 RepID=UPI001244AD5D|nr:G-type lectin S-receptor-like serine/threonine-protein kinase RLK1 [Quercus lobata]